MASLKEINVDGHKIVALEFNKDISSIPIIFIHGVTASINFWEPIQIPIIKDEFHWYSLSLPGHFPACLPSGFNKKDMTDDLIGEILHKGINELIGDQSYILAGHSTGGFAALHIAAKHPENIVSVISISGFAEGKWNGILGLLQILARTGMVGRTIFRNNLKILKKSRSIYHIAAGFYAKDRNALYSYPAFESIFDLIHRDAKDLNHDSLIAFFNRLPDIEITDELPKITAPTLVLAGKHDPVIPHDQPSLIAENVKNCELFLMDGCGHLPMFESPYEYNQKITEWIEKF